MSKEEIRKLAKEVVKPIKKKFPRRQVVLDASGDLTAMDLMDMGSDMLDNDFRFALIGIDVHSRFGFAIPTKKDGTSMLKSVQELLDNSFLIPTNVWTDRGTEFYNSKVSKLFKDNGIHHYSTSGESKSAPVERLIRTIKIKLKEEMIVEGHQRWTELLPEVMEEYNTTKHSSTGKKPIEVYTLEKDHTEKVKDVKEQTQKFKKGDKVRISMVKGIFQKESHFGNWSYEVFTVSAILDEKKPRMYRLKDWNEKVIDGAFYQQELQKTEVPNVFLVENVIRTRTRNGKNESLVKWLGHSELFNEWIDSSEVQNLQKKK